MSPRKEIENLFSVNTRAGTNGALQFALDNLVLGKCNLSLYLAPELAEKLYEAGEKLRAGLPSQLQPKFTDHVFIELILTAAISNREQNKKVSLIKRAADEWRNKQNNK